MSTIRVTDRHKPAGRSGRRATNSESFGNKDRTNELGTNMRSKKWIVVYSILSCLLLLFIGCGDSEIRGQGAICTPDESVEKKNCLIEGNAPDRSSGDIQQVYIDEPSDMDHICRSECNRAELIVIDNVDALENLQALSRLDSIEVLKIERSDRLSSLEGITKSTEIGGLTLRSNKKLETLQGLGEDTKVGSLKVIENRSLDSLAGIGEHFENLSRFEVRYNELEQFGLQESLDVSEDAFVTLKRESRVDDFEGLEGLTEVGTLYQGSMDNVTSFDGLDNLQSVRNGLSIRKNENLAPCRVEQFVDRVATSETDVETFANRGSADCSE